MSNTATKVFSRFSLAKLENSGSDTEIYDGWRFILNRHYMSDSSSSQESVVPIPDEIESKQTLVSMGMTDGAAEATYQRFQLARTNMPDDELLGFAKGTVRRRNDAVDEDDNWRTL